MTGDQPTVVSTTPSGTEILYALGVEPAAVSHACDYPPAAAERPTIDASRVDADGSADRDAQADGEIYDVDVDLLRDLEPELIVTQSVCGVCAVDERLVERHLADLDVDPTVLPTTASDLASVGDCVREVGAALDRTDRAAGIVDRFESRLDDVRDRTAAVGRPTVAVLEWMDPLHAAGNWVPELVAAAGGDYLPAEPGQRSVELAWEELRALDPDVLVVAPCSFGPAETVDRADELRDRPGWDDLQAVQSGDVYVLDGRLLNRWTPRLTDAAEELARALHPSLSDEEHSPRTL